MRPLFKSLIITIVAVSVVIPAGFYAFTSFSQTNVSLTQVVPGNSTLVISGSYNGTPAYIFNSSGTSGIALGVNLAGFSSEVNTISTNTTSPHTTLEPSLYDTYRGYSIYQVKNVSLNNLIPQNITGLSAQYNISFNATSYMENNTIYVADFTSVVSIGSYESVVMTINTLLDKTGFTALSDRYFNSTANVSLYFNSSNLPVKQGIVNVYSLKSTFNIEFNSTDTAQSAYKLIGGSLFASSNYTYFPAVSTEGAWVNGTFAVGIDNYFMIQYILEGLSTLNYTQYLTGQFP